MPNIKFSVGVSRKWNPEEAGHEAVSKALKQLVTTPKFLLIFSTIHYDKEKYGMQRLLNTCRSLIPKEVPSVGGVVTAFICPEGSYARGVVVVAGGGDDIELTTNYGEKVIYNPKLVGEKIGNEVSKNMKLSKGSNKVLIEFSLGPTEPPLMADPKVHKFIRYIYNKFPCRLSWVLRDIILHLYISITPTGPGREETMLSEMEKYLEEYYFIGCSTFDNMKCLKHYQFYNDKVLYNSTVAIGLSLDNDILLERKVPVLPTGKKFHIKRGWKNFMVDQIDCYPAASMYIKKMGWPEEYIQSHIENVTKKTFYYPLGFMDKNQLLMFTVGFFYGESIVTNREIKSDDVELFVTSTKKVFEDLQDCLLKIKDKETEFTLFIKHMNIIGSLASNFHVMKNIMDKTLKNSPYLLLLGAGEHSKLPYEETIFNDYSMVMLSILKSSSKDQ